MEITPVFRLFWYFAAERQNVFFKRLRGEPGPWTTDPILQTQKFCNAYRIQDRSSQYLIRSIIYDGEENIRNTEDTFFRILLYKLFNLPETWERLAKLGKISYRPGILEDIDTILTECVEKNIRTCSPAYMLTGSGSKGKPRHRMYLHLLDQWMSDGVPKKMADAKSMEEVFKIFHSYRLIGPFLAYQFATDVNYSMITDFSEMEFTVPGPGSTRGIRKCFTDIGDYSPEEIIRYVSENQEKWFNKFGFKFQRLGDRPLQLIDCQSLFCEVDKYSRVSSNGTFLKGEGKRMKSKFHPSSKLIDFTFPPKWKISI